MGLIIRNVAIVQAPSNNPKLPPKLKVGSLPHIIVQTEVAEPRTRVSHKFLLVQALKEKTI